MTKTISALLAASLLAIGCGDDESNGGGTNEGGGAGGATTPAPEVTGEDRAAAIETCLERAREIADDSVRRTAEEACEAAETGDASAVLESARRQCLEGLTALPKGDVRDRGREACERLGRQ